LLRGLSENVPLFNQPNELAADTAGTDTILAAGGRRTGYHLTEGGALLMMQFFASSDQLSPEDILFGFERTHPPPAIRIPVIQQTANLYRISGGTWVPLLRL
jgi:predicted Zn-dependent protease